MSERVGDDWLEEFGLIAASGEGADRSGQDRMFDPLEVPGIERVRAAEAGAGAASGCSRGCAGCGCGGTEGEGR